MMLRYSHQFTPLCTPPFRFHLPCDLGVSASLWAMPAHAKRDPDALSALRRADLSDARMPYASAVRTLRYVYISRYIYIYV